MTSKQAIRLLKENGFILDHATGSHYIFYQQSGKKRAVVPFHAKDLPLGTLKSILKTAGIEY